MQQSPKEVVYCYIYQDPVSKKDIVINERFINEAMESGRNIEVHPIVIKDNQDVF